MSTATANRAVPPGNDSFPVLLRLPDLNAPVIPPALLPEAAKTTVSGVEPIAEPKTASAEPATPIATAKHQDLDSPLATTTIAATSSEAISTNSTVEGATIAAPPLSRRERLLQQTDLKNFQQWPLMKQLTAGGVLVGGLLLAFVALSGGDEPTPPHVDIADVPLEAPLIEIPSPTAVPVAPAIDVSPTENDFAETVPPTGFRNYAGNSGSDAVAPPASSKLTQDQGIPNFDNPTGTLYSALRPTEPSEGDPNIEAYSYPVTHPSTFENFADAVRPSPGERGPVVAHREGTNAPPPRR